MVSEATPIVMDCKLDKIFYGNFMAVRDSHVPIRKNEITGFIGPSGCGKSTVLRSLNRMNDLCWAGAFTWWGEEKLLVFRYGLVLAGDQVASAEQVDTMIHAAVMSAERFYPAIQLALWDDRTAASAMQAAIAEAYGRA